PASLGERPDMAGSGRGNRVLTAGLIALAFGAPVILYPVFVMEALCFALFACAFNLLIGYVGLLSFGHAAFFGSAAYVTAHTVKVWGLPPSSASSPGPPQQLYSAQSSA